LYHGKKKPFRRRGPGPHAFRRLELSGHPFRAVGLDAAHTVIGIAIPALIIGSGIAIEASRPKPVPVKAESP
jgi:hypothetical protein